MVGMFARRVPALLAVLALLGLSMSGPWAASPAWAAVSVSFSQCENQTSVPHDCGWVPGVLGAKATYAEGMSVPQRAIFTGIPDTATHQHTLTFTMAWTKGGKHAYDWLTSYEQAVQASKYYGIPFNDLNVCDPEPGGTSTTCTALRGGPNEYDVPVPNDSFLSHTNLSTQDRINEYVHKFGTRVIQVYSSDPISALDLQLSHSVANNADTGDSDVTYTLSWTGSADSVMIAMAAHIAKGSGVTGWGDGSGAAAISGSPYHISLQQLDGASLGSQDNQMKSSTVVVPSYLEVKKTLVPSGDSGKFDLQIDGVTRAADVGDGGDTGLISVTQGAHSVGEAAGTGSDLADYNAAISCDNGASGSGNSLSGVNVAEGETVVCTITNTRKSGTLEVVKHLSPTTDPGRFDLSIDGTVRTGNPVGNGGTTGAIPVNAGTHTFSESAGSVTSLADYTASASCADATGAPVAATAVAGNYSVPVADGQAVTCTITNTRNTGTLEIVKDLSPSTDPGTFDLSIDGNKETPRPVGNGGSTGPIIVNTGDHTFSEAAASGTSLSNYTASVSCTDGTASVTPTGPDVSGNYTVSVGNAASVVCTITNTRIATPPPPPPPSNPGIVVLSLAKTAVPVSGSVVQPGQTIDYTITAKNSGNADAPGVTVVDTLPQHLTVSASSISDNGVLDNVARTVTWTIGTLGADTTKVLTFTATVDQDTPQGTDLVNVATLGNQQSSTTHRVATGDLTLVKTVDPTSGAQYGSKLTYGLTAAATGTLDQTGVTVTDVVPTGTTYVADSAKCLTGSCTATYDAASHTITWRIGKLAAGSSRGLQFQVTIDTPPAAADGSIPATTIMNVGNIKSDQAGVRPSNEVKTDVVAVLGIKVVKPPVVNPPAKQPTVEPQKLPFTGAPTSLQLGAGGLLLMLGAGLLLASRRRRA